MWRKVGALFSKRPFDCRRSSKMALCAKNTMCLYYHYIFPQADTSPPALFGDVICLLPTLPPGPKKPPGLFRLNKWTRQDLLKLTITSSGGRFYRQCHKEPKAIVTYSICLLDCISSSNLWNAWHIKLFYLYNKKNIG